MDRKREALDRAEISGSRGGHVGDPAAGRKALSFMRSLAKRRRKTPAGRTWTRESLYEDRNRSMAEVLIDTNILVYAHQPGEKNKYIAALHTLERLLASGAARLSAQIVAEFISATTRGRAPILTMKEALEQATRFTDAFPAAELCDMA